MVGGRLRTLLSGVALSLVAAGLAVVLPAGPAHAAWTTPAQERSIGGTGRASLFPWGMAWNPVSEKYVVTDYFNYQVRQYNADWTYDKTLPQPSAATGDPESVLAAVAVDPRNGDVYVGKPKPDTLAHYDAAGNRLPDVVVDPGSGTQTYTAWLTIDDEGYIYVLDSHLWNTAADPSRLIKLAPGGGSQVAVWDLNFAGPAARPVLRDRRRRRRQDLPRRLDQPARAGALARRRLPGARSAAPADRRSTAGSPVTCAACWSTTRTAGCTSWTRCRTRSRRSRLDRHPAVPDRRRRRGHRAGQLIAPRSLTFGPEGHLWVTEYGNYRIQAFDPATGASLDIQPSPLPDRPMGQLGQPRDVAVDPATGDVWVADTWNQRFCRYAADGTHEGCWGGRGNLPPYGIKYPRGIGFDPVNRRVWVANNAGGTIYVYDDQANFLFQVGNEDNRRNSVPGMFEKPFAIGFGNGYAYVTDVGSTYEGNAVKVKILNATTGVEVGTIARNSRSVAVDEATGQVYVADAGVNQQKIYVYGPTGGPRDPQLRRQGHRQRTVHRPVGRDRRQRRRVRDRRGAVTRAGVQHDRDVPRQVGRCRDRALPAAQPLRHLARRAGQGVRRRLGERPRSPCSTPRPRSRRTCSRGRR